MDTIIDIVRQSLQNIVTSFFDQLPELILGVIVFIIFFLSSRWVKKFVIEIIDRSGLSSSAGTAIGRLSQWTTVLVGLLVAASIGIESFNPGELIQLLGISSVVIGFAFRDILQNFLAGILILITEPFKIGDQIIASDFEGTVTQIDTRATMIRTYDNRLVVMPNADLFTYSVIINTAFEVRRSEYDIGIGYGDDIQRASQLIIEAMKSVQGVLEDPPPDVRIWDLASSTLNIRARWWTYSQRGDVTQVKSKVLSAITQKLGENGIDLPYETQVMLFHDQTEAVDGDRLQQREGWPAEDGVNAPKPLTIAGSLKQLAEALVTSNGKS